jgi:uncharacterized protein YbaP (TraB family)
VTLWKIRLIRQFSSRLFVALIALCCWQAPASADPALWVLRDADSTIYLFGTVHAMKPGVNWHTTDIDAAFAASSDLWVEETGDEDQTLMTKLVTRYGLDPAHPLSAKLTPEQRTKLAKAVQAAGLNLTMIDQARPWLAAISLSTVPLVQAGYDPEQGIDKSLRQEAAAAGKPVHSFETPEQQIHIFADLPPQDELAALTQALEDIDQGPALIGQLIDDWLEGDVQAIDQNVSADMRKQSPSLYKALFFDRNVAWTKRIEEMLAGKGVTFIAVGAGHLAGSDSVIALLEHDGHRVTRE